MRLPLAALLLAAVAGSAGAADTAKPNTLTPKEVADGWILLFDGATTFGWKIDGEASVKDGALLIGGDKPATATLTTTFGSSCDLKLEHGPWRGREIAKVSLAAVFPDGGTIDSILNVQPSDPAQVSWGRGSLNLTADRPCRAAIRVDVPAGGRLSIRDVKLRPLGLKSLFNGKNLSGWKKYEGDKARAKTEFSVTPEGWLHLKNGPGDLQSEGRYADFVLQAECRTNGDRLNSGVFFRCIPGEYQNGYEAQIHNGFDATKPKKYTVEEFDPKTHEPTGKKEVTSPAIDYGTGAIYRRVPARNQAAKDREWFTMTVVAQGRHVATWVNGVQEVDWTDNRPPKDNPRNGCRLEAGPISLQGHDATTDIDFRSIRIAELPK